MILSIVGWAVMAQHIGFVLVQQFFVLLVEQQAAQIYRILVYALVPVVIAFSFFIFVIYRSRRETVFRQKETQFKLDLAEGELKALRAQINPHFIFNCLNSIHHYMHLHHAQAGEYLIKFSQLIRHVLESSAMRMVSLQDEIEANQYYIQLEQLRMNHAFNFSIEIDKNLDAYKVHIPPMLLQPFIENSIWHGLNHRPKEGMMQIYFLKKDDKHIQCTIRDNGNEGTKSDIDISHRVKKTSMGMQLIQDRLKAINILYNAEARFEIKLLPEGKEVMVLIPFDED